MREKKKGGNRTGNQKLITNPELRGQDKAKLNRYQKEDFIKRIIGWIYEEGYSKTELIKRIQEEGKEFKLSYNQSLILAETGIATLEVITKQDAPQVIAVHTGHYVKIWKYFKEIEHVPGQNKALKANEKINGIKERSTTKVNIKKNTVITKEVEYNTSSLDDHKKKRLEFLINKMK